MKIQGVLNLRGLLKNYLYQASSSAFFKASTIIITFMTTPVLVNGLGPRDYGVWSTLISFFSWIVILELGLPAALQTKVARLIASGELVKVPIFIGNALKAIVFVVGIGMVFMFGLLILNEELILNILHLEAKSLRLIYIGLALSAVVVMLNLLGGLVGALQKSSYVPAYQFISAALLFIYINFFWGADLLSLVSSHYLSIIISMLLIYAVVVYKHRFAVPILTPELGVIQEIIRGGSGFFLINVASLILYSTDKVLIAALLSYDKVTQYDLVMKILSAWVLLHGIISMPLWGIYASELEKKNFSWVISMLKTQMNVVLFIAAGLILTVLFADDILKVWLGTDLYFDLKLTVWLAFFVVLSCWNNVYAMVLNGAGDTRLQSILAIVAAAVNIPLSIFLVRYCDMGIYGVVASTTVCMAVISIGLPVRVFSILRCK